VCTDDGQLLEVVHCDVSPDNLYVTDAGVVRVLDFGIAEVRQRSAPAAFLPPAGVPGVRGKRHYIAPERLCHGVTHESSDVWSLGVVLYELLAGAPLFRGEIPALCVRAGRALPLLPAATPAAVIRLVERMLAANPAARPGFLAVAAALAAALQGHAVVDDAPALARARDEAVAAGAGSSVEPTMQLTVTASAVASPVLSCGSSPFCTSTSLRVRSVAVIDGAPTTGRMVLSAPHA
jgi:serine/threonine-protein kinase